MTAPRNDSLLSTVPDLADLRQRIDEIDNRLQELLIERAEIVGAVAASKRVGGGKSDAAFYQPAREAQILRRLALHHRGALPFASVVRIWREMLAATVRLETRFSVAVFAPPEAPGCWDLARDHYGSQTPISACCSTGEVIRAVGDGSASVGILPMPEEDEPDPWWPQLLPADAGSPRIIARLPFGGRGNARDRGGDALAIGRCVQQASGIDRTMLAIEGPADVGRARLLSLLTAADFTCVFCASSRHGETSAMLIDLDGFAPLADRRLVRLGAELGTRFRLLALGGYAVPLSEELLSGSAAKG